MRTVDCVLVSKENIPKPINIAALLPVIGVTKDGLENLNLDEEYVLIKKKLSKLSSKKRGFIIQLYKKLTDDIELSITQHDNADIAESRL